MNINIKALKKFVIITFLNSCNNYPYCYYKYTYKVGCRELVAIISDIIYSHHPHRDNDFRKITKGILKYIDTKDKKYLDGAFSSYYKNKLIEYICLKVTIAVSS